MFTTKLSHLKGEFIRNLENLKNEFWQSADINFQFAPFSNRGWKGAQTFLDASNQEVKLILFGDQEFNQALYDFVKEMKKESNHNYIRFCINRQHPDDAMLTTGYDKNIDDNVLRNLSKSKIEKLVPWWELELAAEQGLTPPKANDEPPETLKMFDALCKKLPSSEPALKDPEAMRRDELYHSLASYASDKQNPLWDYSVVVLKKDSSGNFSAELYANYAESDEDLANGYSTTEQGPINNVTDRMKSIYHALQEKTQPLQWDMIAISVSNSGSVEANFELNDEEVFLEDE